MKNSLLLFIFSLITSGLFAQQTGRIGSHDAIAKWTPSSAVTTPFTSAAEGRNIAQDIIDIVGLKANFDIREANIPNAAAVVYGGKRYILYNPNFIDRLTRVTGTRWAAISVLAHEIGHHLNGHTITARGSQPALELEADEFSGFVLRKMGASLAEAQAAMKTLATASASRTHPGQYDRLASIAKGWNSANGQVADRTAIAKASPMPDPPPVERAMNRGSQQTAGSSRIIGDIRFKADPRTPYYVTAQYNVVRAGDSRVHVVGKIKSLNNSRFPYVIYDNSVQLYVDATGNIYTRRGEPVGSLSARRS
ncbi:MAG TPA: hypothetical protein VFS22_07615 [Flavisolibacter sp.]|nr:hypothetical protein [Flavisolibacter sp.]